MRAGGWTLFSFGVCESVALGWDSRLSSPTSSHPKTQSPEFPNPEHPNQLQGNVTEQDCEEDLGYNCGSSKACRLRDLSLEAFRVQRFSRILEAFPGLWD